MTLSLEQRRIAAAYALLDDLPKEQMNEWSGIVQGFGAEVQRCGLLQTIAFLQRKGSLAVRLCRGLSGHLVQRGLIERTADADRDARALLRVLQDMDADRYMLVTREVLAFSVWLKRASQPVA